MVNGCQLPGLLAYWGNYTIGYIVDYISQDIFRILFFFLLICAGCLQMV
jgi:hypothetical protein